MEHQPSWLRIVEDDPDPFSFADDPAAPTQEKERDNKTLLEITTSPATRRKRRSRKGSSTRKSSNPPPPSSSSAPRFPHKLHPSHASPLSSSPLGSTTTSNTLFFPGGMCPGSTVYCRKMGEGRGGGGGGGGGLAPAARAFGCVAVVGSKMVVFGGKGNKQFRDLWTFDILTEVCVVFFFFLFFSFLLPPLLIALLLYIFPPPTTITTTTTTTTITTNKSTELGTPSPPRWWGPRRCPLWSL